MFQCLQSLHTRSKVEHPSIGAKPAHQSTVNLPIRSATQSPSVHRDRAHRQYQEPISYDRQGQRLQQSFESESRDYHHVPLIFTIRMGAPVIEHPYAPTAPKATGCLVESNVCQTGTFLPGSGAQEEFQGPKWGGSLGNTLSEVGIDGGGSVVKRKYIHDSEIDLKRTVQFLVPCYQITQTTFPYAKSTVILLVRRVAPKGYPQRLRSAMPIHAVMVTLSSVAWNPPK